MIRQVLKMIDERIEELESRKEKHERRIKRVGLNPSASPSLLDYNARLFELRTLKARIESREPGGKVMSIFKPDPEKIREARQRIGERMRNFVYTPEHAQHELELYEEWNRWRARMVENEYLRELEAIIRIMIQRLGGKVVITDEEYEQARKDSFSKCAMCEYDRESGVRVLTVRNWSSERKERKE